MKTRKSLAWLACLALLYSLTDLMAEETAVVKEGRVNVRGQPSLVGEVITQLQKGEKVVVLEQVNVAKPKTNEPPRWAKIQMPPNTPVWLNATYIDPANKTVKVNRLNLRAGPGENYSVVGRLAHGALVTEIRRVEDWMEIETPPGAYGFVAADLLTKPEETPSAALAKEEPAKIPAATVPPPEPAKVEPAPVPPPIAKQETPPPTAAVTGSPEPAPVPKAEPATPPPAEAPAPAAQAKTDPAPPPVAVPPAATAPPSIATTMIKPPAEELVHRVVRREGLVRSTVSIQAPTYYELLNPDNRKTINYLHTDNLQVNLKDYRGRRIIVTGEEAIDPRWPKTPVIEVDSLELIP